MSYRDTMNFLQGRVLGTQDPLQGPGYGGRAGTEDPLYGPGYGGRAGTEDPLYGPGYGGRGTCYGGKSVKRGRAVAGVTKADAIRLASGRR